MRASPLGLLALLPLAAQASDLSLRHVMLSTGGVGYFEYAAEADGPATLGLDVPLAQVDDVLASLVVFDSAGSVGGVDLPGLDGTRAAFAALPIGPGALKSAIDYLNSLQGVTLVVAGPRPMTGRLMRAEAVSDPAPPPAAANSAVHRTRVTLLTAAGLQQFVLEDADSVQVADPELRAAIERALDALRAEPAQAARHLRLRGGGSGHRDIRVGYVAGAPLWKTTYRVVLPATDGAPARLQAWAVLENQSGADWNGVDLTLQYGNPVTFRQALYRSYYVQRPEVPLDILGRILPGIDPGTDSDVVTGATRGIRAGLAAAPIPMAAPRAMAKSANMAPSPAEDMAEPETAAVTTEAAESTQFHIPVPVSLPAGHSASVPILDRTVPAERTGLVQQGRSHPLQTLQIRNDTGASLPAGMLTLYDPEDSATFAGNARLGGLPPGETRLLEFAEDLRTRTGWQASAATTLSGVSAAQGVLTVQNRQRVTHRITLTAPAAEPRHLLLEIPRLGAGSTLSVDDGLKASGETASAWRVPLTLKAGETRVVSAHVDEMLREDVALLEDQTVLATVLGSQAMSEPARAALAHIAALRTALTQRVQAREQLNVQIRAVEADEDRVRKNLSAVNASDPLRTRLTRTLEADEDKIVHLTASMAEADTAVTAARAALEQAVLSLKL